MELNNIKNILILAIGVIIPLIAPLAIWLLLEPVTFWQKLVMLIIHVLVTLVLYIAESKYLPYITGD